MEAKLPYAELVDQEKPPAMSHCLGPEGLDHYWCGAPRDPNRPPRFNWHGRKNLECVVCEDLLNTHGPWWVK